MENLVREGSSRPHVCLSYTTRTEPYGTVRYLELTTEGKRHDQTMAGFLGSLFGKPAKAAAPTPKTVTANDSIMNMKNTQEMLKKKQAVLEAKITTETENAKRLAVLMKTNPRKKNGVYQSLPCMLRAQERRANRGERG